MQTEMLVLHQWTGRRSYPGGMPREGWSMLRLERRSGAELERSLLVLLQGSGHSGSYLAVSTKRWSILRKGKRSAQTLWWRASSVLVLSQRSGFAHDRCRLPI